MVVYTEGGITFRIVWANKPFTLRQGEGLPPVKLVAVRLAGHVLQVGVEDPPGPVRWCDPRLYLDDRDAEAWKRRGFGSKPHAGPRGHEFEASPPRSPAAPEEPAGLVVRDPEILGGMPVFAGTRVPIGIVLACADSGLSVARIAEHYPCVTEEHIRAARRHALRYGTAPERKPEPLGVLVSQRVIGRSK